MQSKFILSEIFINNFEYPDLAHLKVLNWLVCSKKLTSNRKTDVYTAAFVKWWCESIEPSIIIPWHVKSVSLGCAVLKEILNLKGL